MKVKALFLSVIYLLLVGCCSGNPFIYPNYCQFDYWNDNQFSIFGRKNCVGNTGRWIDMNNGRDGFYCTGPRCITYDRVRCTATCNCS